MVLVAAAPAHGSSPRVLSGEWGIIMGHTVTERHGGLRQAPALSSGTGTDNVDVRAKHWHALVRAKRSSARVYIV